MAGKGGGAWKVAYADFVTAMMAFFLVMWIVGQDKKVKEAVAHYFMDPMGHFPMGSSRTPAKSGSLFQSVQDGNVPDSEKVPNGRGRGSYADQAERGPATIMVGQWLQSDPDLSEKWTKEAEECREEAELSPAVRSGDAEAEYVAKTLLARRLKDDVITNIPKEAKGIYQDMLYAAMNEVNWSQLAEDMQAQER